MPNPKILIVDDNVPHRTVVKKVLSTQGYDFAEAGSAEEAIMLYRQNTYDIILLDVMLPEMDGVALLKIMREFKPDDDTPVIFVSARSDKKTIMEGLELGAMEYLTKPLDYNELQIRVGTLLRLRKLQSDLRVQERAFAEQKALSEMLITLAHYINNAASSVLLLSEVVDENDVKSVQHFRSVVKQQTEMIVNVIRALQKIVASGNVSTEAYASSQAMIDLKSLLSNIPGVKDSIQ
jgi:DNA-binding response OmpR family regulator